MCSKDNEWGNIEIPGLTEEEVLDPRLTVKLNNRSRAKGSDPNWLANTLQKNKNITKTKKWQEANAIGHQKRMNDPNWHQNVKAAAKRRSEYGKWLKENDPEEFKRFFGYIEQHSKETKAQMKDSAKQRWAKHKRPKVMADGVEYENFLICAEQLGIHKDTVTYRCKVKSKTWEGWYFIKETS